VVALGALRAVNALSRRTGRGAGTVAGGRVALLLQPRLVARLATARQIALVSGTNGKTTTTALLAAALGGATTNETGSNMTAGHVAALASRGRGPVVLETDEAFLPTTLTSTSPDVVVLLNLSRDQLDRSSEVRQLAEKWRDALRATTALVVANVNDPLVVYAASSATRVLWVAVPTYWLGDAASCPQCTAPLAVVDGWECRCGFQRPEPDATYANGTLASTFGTTALSLSLPGRFNEANAALAAVAAAALGRPLLEAVAAMRLVQSVAGRFSLRRRDGVRVRLHLAKNPAGVAALVADDHAWSSPLVIAINDEGADGRDPSWLYDAPFELLRGHDVKCDGSRALDLAARLYYADVDATLLRDEPLRASEDVVDVIANYTAFRHWMEASSPC